MVIVSVDDHGTSENREQVLDEKMDSPVLAQLYFKCLLENKREMASIVLMFESEAQEKTKLKVSIREVLAMNGI